MSNLEVEFPRSAEQSHNLVGQRLGRKGRVTRDRILAAATRILQHPEVTPLSLSAVAREASVGMTTLYLYFADLGDLVLAALEPVVEDSASFVGLLNERWPDDRLEVCATAFLEAHGLYWKRHARSMQIWNGYSEANDTRFLKLQVALAGPVVNGLIAQMDPAEGSSRADCAASAWAISMAMERLASTGCAPDFHLVLEGALGDGIGAEASARLLGAHARLVALTIADHRARAKA